MILTQMIISQVAEVPLEEVLQAVMALVGGVKGASVLAISALAIQVLLKFFSSSLSSFAGKYKLMIVYALSLVAGVVSSLVAGVGVVQAVLNANVLAAAQVFGFEVYKQFFQKEVV